jgi:hypothetical protein
MSELPPTIDAILESIRARVTGEPETAPVDRPVSAPTLADVEPEEIDLGAVSIERTSLTLDGLIRQMLEPMLQHWLDANLPEIVERVARAEIKRISGRS